MSNDKDFKVKNGIQPTVYHEGLGTVVSGSVGYSLGSASYDSVSFSVASEDTVPYQIAFNNDGTKLFMLGIVSDKVHQYTLSTAFDISTASYDSVSFSVSSQETDAYGLAFNNDGTKMYIVGNSSNSVFQYSLSTGFDISTASYNSVSLNVNSQDSIPTGIAFNNTGSKLYMIGQSSDKIHQYSLSTAYDLSTASYDSVDFSIASEETSPMDIAFNNDGTKMYMLGALEDKVHQYSLSTGFDISTASYDSISFSVNSQDSNPRGFVFNNDGTKMYIVGNASDNVHVYSTVLTTAELDLSTGSVFEVTPTSDIQVTLSNPADSGTVSGATLLLDQQGYGGYQLANAEYSNVSFSVAGQSTFTVSLVFNSSGTRFFLLQSNGSVYQYSLSTAWDVSTASYDSVSFDPTGQMTNPYALEFANSGSKMYIQDYYGPVYEYTLSTAFDLSTASYSSNNYDPTQITTQGYGIAFNSDGTKVYLLSATEDSVFQYSLSTAYNISTASYDSKSLSVASEDGTAYDITFNDTGTKLFVMGNVNDTVFQYNLTTAYDISTASYSSTSFSLSSQENNPTALTFKPDGSKMYIVGFTNATVYQYNTATPATITYDTAIEWPSGTAPTSPAIGDTDVVTFNTRDGGSTYQGVLAIDGAK